MEPRGPHTRPSVTPTEDLIQAILTILHRVKTGVPRPTTAEEHVAPLRERAPISPFWNLQCLAPKEFKEGRYVDPAQDD